MRVVVVGAGVVGLLSAHELAHRGHDVSIVTAEDPGDTTSATAGASVKLRTVAPGALTDELFAASRRVLDGWGRSGFADAIGLVRHHHVLASDGPAVAVPPGDVSGVRRRSRDRGDDVVGGHRTELSFMAWFADVPRVLPALVGHVGDDHGVPLHRRHLARLGEVADDARLVVNATGVGARALVGDQRVEPVRGQGVVVPFADPPDWSVSADGFYAYPRVDGLFLGGTADRGAWDRTPDLAVTRRLVAGNVRTFPELADLAADESSLARLPAVVGLRPYRHGGIRLELDREAASVPVVHAYGHGGAGWTLAPGTAERVADLVDQAARHG